MKHLKKLFIVLVLLTSCSNNSQEETGASTTEPLVFGINTTQELTVSNTPIVCEDGENISLCPVLFNTDGTLFNESNCRIQQFVNNWELEETIKVSVVGQDDRASGGCGPIITFIESLSQTPQDFSTERIVIDSFESLSETGFLGQPVVWTASALEIAQEKKTNQIGGIIELSIESSNLVIREVV